MGFSFQLLQLIEAIIIFIPLFIYLTKKSFIPWLSLLFYIGLGNLNQAMNISRQYISIGFILISILFAERKQLKQFLLFVGIAFLFHQSSIFALLLYPMLNLENRKYNKYAIMLIPAGFVISRFLMKYIIPYISSAYYHQAEGREGSSLLVLLLCILACLVYISKRRNTTNINFAIRLTSLTIFFHLFVGQIVAIGRIGYYFSVPLFLLLPNELIKLFSKRSRFVFTITAAILISVYYIFLYLPGGASMTVPYRFGQL